MANSSFPRSLIPAGVNYSIMVYVVDTMTWALLSELCHDNAQLTNIWLFYFAEQIRDITFD